MFDRAVVISLPERSDRRKALDLSGLGMPWSFIDGVRTQAPGGSQLTDGHYGCYVAHRTLLTQLCQTEETVLILEDDAWLVPDFGVRLAAFEAALTQLPAWDGLYLGGAHMKPPASTGVTGVLAVTNTWCTHAYALRGLYLHRVVARMLLDSGYYLEQTLMDVVRHGHVYCPESWLVYQDDEDSDTGNPLKLGSRPALGSNWSA